MDFTQFLAGGALLGLLAAAWGYLKNFAWKLLSILVQKVDVAGELGPIVRSHLIKEYKFSKVYDRYYTCLSARLAPGFVNGSVPFERIGMHSMLFWRGWWPLILVTQPDASWVKRDETGRAATTPNHNTPTEEHGRISISLLFLRGTWDPDEVTSIATKLRNERTWDVESLADKKSRRHCITHVPESNKDVQAANRLSTELWYRDPGNRILAYDVNNINPPEHPDRTALGDLYFPESVRGLTEEIKVWRSHQEWYRKKGIPWKRGWLLFGPPGTGKTALARAFAEDLDLPIYVYHLGQLSNRQFTSAWSKMRNQAPCMALIEDIDNVFHGRKNVTQAADLGMSMFGRLAARTKRKNDDFPEDSDSLSSDDDDDKDDNIQGGYSPLTFDCLLNLLDGVERNDGIFTIVTTNDLSKIDEAIGRPRKLSDGSTEFISTRPGRIDKAVELTYMQPAEKLQMANRILGDYPEELDEIRRYIAGCTIPETPAQFQERCAQLALKRFWQAELACPKKTA